MMHRRRGVETRSWRAAAFAALALSAFFSAGCGKKPSSSEITTKDLLNNLQATAAETRVSAAVELGDRRDGAAVPGLCAALKDIRADVRKAAIDALGKIGDPAAVGPIAALVNSTVGGEEQQRLAANALGNIGSLAAVPVLAEALSSSDEGRAHAAAFALSQIGDDTALDALIAAIRGESSYGPKAAAGALGSFPGERSRKTLRGLLSDGSPSIRLSAAENLARMGDKQAVSRIVDLLLDPDQTVRLGVRRAVARLGEDAADALVRIVSMRGPYVDRAGPDGKMIKVPVGGAREVALKSLMNSKSVAIIRALVAGMIGQEARRKGPQWERIRELIAEPEYRVELRKVAEGGTQQEALVGLAVLADHFSEWTSEWGALKDRAKLLASPEVPDVEPCRELAARLLKHKEPEIQVHAARLLCLLGDRRGRDLLRKEFWAQVDVVGKAWTEAAKEWDAEYAKTTPEEWRANELARRKKQRERAISKGRRVSNKPLDHNMPAAGEIAASRRAGALARTVPVEPAALAQACLSALLGVADKALVAELLPALTVADPSASGWGSALSVVLLMTRKIADPSYVDHLLPLMKTDSLAFTPHVARALGVLGDKRGFEPIARYTKSLRVNDHYFLAIRRNCYEGLYGCDPDRAAEVVGEILMGIDAHQAAPIEDTVDLIAGYPLPGAVPGLVHWIDHDIQHVQESVAAALAAVGKGHVEWLIEGFEVKAHSKRSALAGVIADEFGESAAPALLAAAKDKRPRVRQGVVWAIGSIGCPEALEVVELGLADQHTGVRTAAIWAAGHLKEKALAGTVLALLDDKDVGVRSMAAKQLGALGDDQAAPPLIAALKDKDEHVRAYAVMSLAKLEAVDALPALEVLESEKDPDVRAAVDYAVRVLRRLRDTFPSR